jgi:predicted RNase H-like HicB family nuclease
MRIDYTVQIWKEGSQFVAHAMPIDVASAGETPDQARTALDEAVHLFLLTAQEKGTLADVLEECAYQLHDGSWQAPEWVAVERHHALLPA